MKGRDWKNIILIFLEIFTGVLQLIDINSLATKLQEYSGGNWKIIGVINDVKLVFIFSLSTAFLLVYNKERIKKYLDELTGKAKGEREYRKQSELANVEFEEKLKLAEMESKERLELDTRKRQQEQVREAEEERAKAQERNRLLSVLKDDLFYEENKHNYTTKTNMYVRTKTIENLKKLGFLYPTDEEQGFSWFSPAWDEFLSVLIAKIECGTEKEDKNLCLWNVVKSKHQNLFKGTP